MKKYLSVLAPIFLMLLFYLQTSAQCNNGWFKYEGGIGVDGAFGIDTDTAGNIYISGYFTSKIIIGNDTLTGYPGATGYDIFIAKYDKFGNPVWARKATGPGSFEAAGKLRLDKSGNIFITGLFQKTCTFGAISVTSAGAEDIFLAKMSPAGDFLWVKRAGGTGKDEGCDIAIDNAGNIYTTGYFTNKANFGPGNGDTLTSYGLDDTFLAKYNNNGNLIWIKQAGGTGYDIGLKLVVDENDNLYITGSYAGAAVFDSINSVSYGTSNFFLAKYNSSGKVQWIRTGKGSDFDLGWALVHDKSSIYLTGSFSGIADYGSGILLSEQGINGDVFFLKYNLNGDVLWGKSCGGTRGESAYNMVLDSDGKLWAGGLTWSTDFTFGSALLTNRGDEDGFIVQLDTNGNFYSAHSIGGWGWDGVYNIKVDKYDNVYAVGFFQEEAYFDTTFIIGKGSYDMFLWKVCGGTVGIDELKTKANSVKIYPNPTTGRFMITVNDEMLKPVQYDNADIEVYNILGEKVQANFKLQTLNFELDISSAPAGMYFIRIYSTDRMVVKKIIRH